MNLRTKVAWPAVGVAVLVGLMFVPALSATTSPSIASNPSASAVTPSCVTTTGHLHGEIASSTDPQWSYGGQGWWNYSFSFDNTTITYNSTFGWTVVFTVTETSPGNWSFEVDRMVGITILKNVTKPKVTLDYCYHAQENDAAFANVTNSSTVYVKGQPVPAFGLVNASTTVQGLVEQTLNLTNSTGSHHAAFNVTANANASVTFSPSLGLFPLNLSGVWMWNSTSTATYQAAWAFAFAYTELNGTSGAHTRNGSLSGSTVVHLFGCQMRVLHPFSDHQARFGVILALDGPFDSYDGFIFVPRAFDLFGPMAHPYDNYQFGSAGISSEELYLSSGPSGFAVTAADESFASNDAVATAAASTPAATVYGQPMALDQAQTLDHNLASGAGLSGGSTAGGSGSTGAPGGGLASASGPSMLLVTIGAVAAVGSLIGVLAWRSYRRRP